MNDATVISKISKEDKRKLKINLKREGKSISGFIRVKIIEKNEEYEIN
jgi:heme-binding NEAT domain protein